MKKTKRFYGKGIPHIDAARLKGRLIVLEGADGSGRSTQIDMLSDWLERHGYASTQVGLKRSELIAPELASAKEGNTLSPLTISLFYATDFTDQLEHIIIPALRADFIVLADRYFYTLVARAMVRGLSKEWVVDLYSIAIVPDAVFYLQVPPHVLAERTFRKNNALDYWESGMDISRAGDMYQNFIRYQGRIRRAFRELKADFGFDVINGNRSPSTIHAELVSRLQNVLESRPD
ncbi:MAG: thymidylate kinase [Anaerolineales bacterium]|jgi:dTMP kinase